MSIFSLIKNLFVKQLQHPEDCQCHPCVIGRYMAREYAANKEIIEEASKLNDMNFSSLDFGKGKNVNIKLPDYPRTDK